MEQLFDITVDEATMVALGIPVRDGVLPIDDGGFDPENVPADPQAEVWELAWQTVQKAESAVPASQQSIRSRIDHLMALRQRMSALQVAEMRELSEIAKLNREQAERHIAHNDPDRTNSIATAQRSLAAELAVANRVSARTMENRIGEAEQLVDLFPNTLESRGRTAPHGEPATGADSPHGAAVGITAEVCVVIPALTLLARAMSRQR